MIWDLGVTAAAEDSLDMALPWPKMMKPGLSSPKPSLPFPTSCTGRGWQSRKLLVVLHRMAWVGRDFKNHLIPTPLPCTGTPFTVPDCSELQPALPWTLQGWSIHSLSQQPVLVPHQICSEEFFPKIWAKLSQFESFPPCPVTVSSCEKSFCSAVSDNATAWALEDTHVSPNKWAYWNQTKIATPLK